MQLSSFAFHFFNLHLGGLVNKITKIYFLRFGGKITFLRFWRKIFLRFLRKIVFLRKKCIFVILAENTFLWVWQKICFCGFGGKAHFAVLAENVFLAK